MRVKQCRVNHARAREHKRNGKNGALRVDVRKEAAYAVATSQQVRLGPCVDCPGIRAMAEIEGTQAREYSCDREEVVDEDCAA